MSVMPDADLDQAVDALIGAGYGSAGDRCLAISVAVPVGLATADALVAKLAERTRTLKIGLSEGESADLGPMVTAAARKKVIGYIDAGVQEGAELVDDYAAAIALPNEHRYGNGMAIFIRDGDAARDFVSRVDTLPGRRTAQGSRAGDGRHLRPGGPRRHRARALGRRSNVRGAGHRVPVDRGYLSIHNQQADVGVCHPSRLSASGV